MSETQTVTMSVPLALQYLVKANNTLLQNYQAQLMEEVQQANLQMMTMLKLDPSEGWRLDIQRMVYIRTTPDEEPQPTE